MDTLQNFTGNCTIGLATGTPAAAIRQNQYINIMKILTADLLYQAN